MPDVIETIKELVRAGASSDEIVQTLRSMGIEEEEARKLILLAERDMLRVLRNEIREIAAEEFVEQAKKMKQSILADVREALDAEIRLSRKRLLDMLRDEVNRYTTEIRHISDKLELLERRVYELEDRVAKIPTYRRKNKGTPVFGYFLTLLGICVVGYALFTHVSGVMGYTLFAIAFGLLLGGAYAGARSV